MSHIVLDAQAFRDLVGGKIVSVRDAYVGDEVHILLSDIGFQAMQESIASAQNAANPVRAGREAVHNEQERRLIREAIEQNGHAGVVTLCCPDCGRLVSTNYAELRRFWDERRDSSAKRG
jgi:hypothetical protein